MTPDTDSVVAARAAVTRSVPAYALVAGVPATGIGWVSRAGEPLTLPINGQAEADYPRTGEPYNLNGEVLQVLERQA